MITSENVWICEISNNFPNLHTCIHAGVKNVWNVHAGSVKNPCIVNVFGFDFASLQEIQTNGSAVSVVILSSSKKEPKSDDRLSKFDWHHLSPIFFNRKAS